MNEIDYYTDWNKSELIKEVKKLNKKKRYGLVWDEEKTKEIFEKESQGKLPVLIDVTKNDVKYVSKPNNILIEGDNYHALSVLNYTHSGKIDVIYIDPPYNTGNEFKYNDNIVDYRDAYRHSKWLSFMSKRLLLSRKLLSKNGVIFISIDENEFAQLKLLCDEIFGENNFYAMLNWTSRTKPTNSGSAKFKIQKTEEYILLYGKNSLQDHKPFNLEQTKTVNYNHNENGQKYRLEEIQQRKNTGMRKRNTMVFQILGISPRKDYRWCVGKEGIKSLTKQNKLIKTNGKVYKKIFSEDESNYKFQPFYANVLDTGGSSETGKAELDEIVSGTEFETVKPTDLIKKLLYHTTDKNSTVLDFFAGSGTTGQAVLQLNKEDGGDRKFVLCTNNEDNICIDVCYPRLKKIINGYENLNGEKIEGLGGNLKYFKTSFVDSDPTDQNKKIMVAQSTKMLCLKEDCFVLVKKGNQFKIFKNHHGAYIGIVYYYDGIIPFKKELLKLKVKINTYVFSLVDEVDSEDFIDVDQWVSLKPIPSVILNVYRRIYVNVRFKKLSRKTHNGLRT